METRYSRDPHSFERMNTAEIRDEFLITNLFAPDEVRLVYLHMDRMIVGSAVPASHPLCLDASPGLQARYFTERREIGIFNIGEMGNIRVDGVDYPLDCQEVLYIGRGSQEIIFSSDSPTIPARFYLVSLPAHKTYPITRSTRAQARRIDAGTPAAANVRAIFQYIHSGGVPSCQLVMGFTELAPGSIWNTMTAHTHERRSEVYLYYQLAGDNVVFHLMGKPQETRHLVVRDEQAVISPSWSIHAGAGTSNYCFIWAMGGENQDFDDIDLAPIDAII